MTFLNRLFKKIFGYRYYKVKGILCPDIYHYYKIKGRKLYSWVTPYKKWVLTDYNYGLFMIFSRQYKEVSEKEVFIEIL